MSKRRLRTGLAALLPALSVACSLSVNAWAANAQAPALTSDQAKTRTPIKHLVVIFDENVSFDHYFGTYPIAANKPGEPAFHARPGTPTVNGLTPALLEHNPNAANPVRLDHSQAVTCDMDHGYTSEQKAYDGGLVDKFVEHTGATGKGCDPKLVMGYYDGNTVTALWNYAQRFAMSENFFNTVYGPSTPGALNLIRGSSTGVDHEDMAYRVLGGVLSSDLDPIFDECGAGTQSRPMIALKGRNVGDLLNGRGLTWGWFQGGFKPTGKTPDGTAVCATTDTNAAGKVVRAYSPHHEPFQYFQQTANPKHLPPSATAMIGKTDQANHQYDLSDFWAAVDAGGLPTVSFLKATAAKDGHAGNSGPVDEQQFLVGVINHLQKSKDWASTAIIVTYDDSDGWYDHVMPPLLFGSDGQGDALNGPNKCGEARSALGANRCGYGPRLPLLVISPFARQNYVDSRLIDQTSILRFIEDNWDVGRLPEADRSVDRMAASLDSLFDFTGKPNITPLILTEDTGQPIGSRSR
jgi:phospholipase C